jgi:hypothetical protein
MQIITTSRFDGRIQPTTSGARKTPATDAATEKYKSLFLQAVALTQLQQDMSLFRETRQRISRELEVLETKMQRWYWYLDAAPAISKQERLSAFFMAKSLRATLR